MGLVGRQMQEETDDADDEAPPAPEMPHSTIFADRARRRHARKSYLNGMATERPTAGPLQEESALPRAPSAFMGPSERTAVNPSVTESISGYRRGRDRPIA